MMASAMVMKKECDNGMTPECKKASADHEWKQTEWDK